LESFLIIWIIFISLHQSSFLKNMIVQNISFIKSLILPIFCNKRSILFSRSLKQLTEVIWMFRPKTIVIIHGFSYAFHNACLKSYKEIKWYHELDLIRNRIEQTISLSLNFFCGTSPSISIFFHFFTLHFLITFKIENMDKNNRFP